MEALSQGEAGRVIDVIDGRIRRLTRSSARVEVTSGRVDQVVVDDGVREAEVFLYGETVTASEGFRVKNGIVPGAGDQVRVAMDERGDRWVEEVIVGTPYSKVEIDLNGGVVRFGAGTTATDARIRRTAAGQLVVDDLGSGGSLGVGGVPPAGKELYVVGDIEATGDIKGATGTLSGLTSGRVVFSTGAGTVATDDGIRWDNTNKRLGIGVAPSHRFDLRQDDTSNAGNNGGRFNYIWQPASVPAGAVFHNALTVAATGRGSTAMTNGTLRALTFSVTSDASVVLPNAQGISGDVRVNGNGGYTSANVLQAYADVISGTGTFGTLNMIAGSTSFAALASGATIGTFRGVSVPVLTGLGAGRFATTVYGIHVGSPSGAGTWGNVYGLRIDSQTTAGTHTNTPYGLFQAGSTDRNYFAGRVGIIGDPNSAPTKALYVVGAIQATGDIAGATFNGNSGTLHTQSHNHSAAGDGTALAPASVSATGTISTTSILQSGSSADGFAGRIIVGISDQWEKAIWRDSSSPIHYLNYLSRGGPGTWQGGHRWYVSYNDATYYEAAYLVDNGGTAQFLVRTDQVYKPSAGSWLGYSDPRLKQRVRSLGSERNGLDIILATRPVLYEWNGLGGTTRGEQHVGVLANEMLEVAPDMVTTINGRLRKEDESTTELLSIDPSDFTYYLIDAVQRLHNRVLSLELGRVL